MTDRYLDPFAVSDGDGTFASPWNGLIDFLQNGLATGPRSGTLNPGDTVWVRSSNDGGTTGYSVTITADLTIDMGGVGTAAAPIFMVVDDGTKWSGDTGSVEIKTSTANVNLTMSGYWHIMGSPAGGGRNFRYLNEYSSHTADWIFGNGGQASFIRSKIERIRPAGPAGLDTNIDGSGNFLHSFVDCLFTINTHGGSGKLVTSRAGNGWAWINCDIDLVNTGGASNFIEGVSSFDAMTLIFDGCRFSNVPADMNFITLQTPPDGNITIRVSNTDLSDFNSNETYFGGGQDEGEYAALFSYEGGGANRLDTLLATTGGVTSFIESQIPPTLTGLASDGTTKLSLRCLPTNGSIAIKPFRPMETVKKFVDTTATRKIGVEMLIPTSPSTTYSTAGIDEKRFWITVHYTDNNDVARTETSRFVAGSVSASTAAWSATTWAANTYSKYKVELTTAQQIKSGTLVRVELHTNVSSVSSAEDFFFVDPEFTVGAP